MRIPKKTLHVAVLVFPGYKSDEMYALITKKQAASIAQWLDREKTKSSIVDYYLGPLPEAKQFHAQFLEAAALRVQLKDLIDLERRRPSGE